MMRPPYSALLQIMGVFVVVAALAYLIIYLNFNSKLNLGWMVGLPIGVTLVANKSLLGRVTMASVLCATAFLAFAFVVFWTGA